MKTSEKTESLISALLKARAAFPVIHKDKTAKVPTKSGGQYQYNYADLSSIIDATKDALLANGLMLQHGMESNGHTTLTCRLSHVSGQWQESAYPIRDDVDAQQMGSAITYGRRYTACAMLGIVTEDDDDGAAAAKPAQQQQQEKPKHVTLKPQQPIPANKPKVAAPANEDRVPAEVTDASPDTGSEGGPDESVELVTLEACTKEREDKKGNKNRGLKLLCADGSSDWWQCYEQESMDLAGKGKGKQFYAKLEDKNGFKLCHNLTEVQA